MTGDRTILAVLAVQSRFRAFPASYAQFEPTFAQFLRRRSGILQSDPHQKV